MSSSLDESKNSATTKSKNSASLDESKNSATTKSKNSATNRVILRMFQGRAYGYFVEIDWENNGH